MTCPSARVRIATYTRDAHRCLACGRTDLLSWQHRESSGNGGRGSKAPELTTADGCTLCLFCNADAEAGGQRRALACGWKIRRNRGKFTAAQLPMFDSNERVWFLGDTDGNREVIPESTARELLVLAGSIPDN